jgi:DNA-binding NarL/FixJ family response regulator
MKHPSDLESLTVRQRAIAQLIACGYTDREIATNFALALSLVADEVEQLRERCGVDTRTQLASLGLSM